MPRPHTACFLPGIPPRPRLALAFLRPPHCSHTPRRRLVSLFPRRARTLYDSGENHPPATRPGTSGLAGSPEATRCQSYARIHTRHREIICDITLHKRKSTQHGSELPRCSTLALSRTFARGTSPRCPDVVRDSTSSARPRPHPHPHNARARVYGSTGWRPISSPRACVNVLSVLIVSPSFTKPIREDGFRHLPGCVPAYASIV